MDFITFLAVLLSVTYVGLGVFVFLKNRKKSLPRLFLLFTLSSFVWVGGLSLVQEEFSNYAFNVAALGLRLAFAGAALAGLFFLLFAAFFTKERKFLNKKIKYTFIIAGSVLALVSIFSSGIVHEVSDYFVLGYFVEYGPLYPVYVLYILAVFSLAFRFLIKRYNIATGVEKVQLKYLLIGATLSIVPIIITNLLYPTITGTSYLSKVGPLFISALVISFAYAISRHGLFNIRIITTELFTALFVLIFLVNFFFSSDFSEYAINGALLIFATVSGALSIRGTIREIKTLEELSETKSEFLSIASHQLRTPLSILKGYLSLLREGSFGKLSSKQLEVINKAYNTNEGMRILVNDFLNLSRAEKGTLRYDFEEVNFNDFVGDIVQEFKMAAKIKGLELKYKKPKETFSVSLDKEKFSQVVSNLIDNAIKYTNEGRVLVRLAHEDRYSNRVRLYVSDTGIGLTEKEFGYIFQSFKRNERGEKMNAGGSGLGLYVAKMITEDHGGEIWAESKGENKGTTFVVELPLA